MFPVGLGDVAHVQLSDVTCLACGGRFDHRIDGSELGTVDEWTVEAVTELACPHCGDRTRWVIEEELRRDPGDDPDGGPGSPVDPDGGGDADPDVDASSATGRP
jgi:DNA-directed RNA polymerase subunit RPC12/RpoP